MDTKPSIKTEMDRILEAMNNVEPGSEEYEKLLKNLNGLLEAGKKSKVSLDVLVNAGVNLLGLLLIMNHERLNVISTKALMFVKRST